MGICRLVRYTPPRSRSAEHGVIQRTFSSGSRTYLASLWQKNKALGETAAKTCVTLALPIAVISRAAQHSPYRRHIAFVCHFLVVVSGFQNGLRGNDKFTPGKIYTIKHGDQVKFIDRSITHSLQIKLRRNFRCRSRCSLSKKKKNAVANRSVFH